MHEVAHVVGQEDRRAVEAGPDRLRVVPHGHVELGIVGPFLDRRAQVEGRDAQDARELARLDTAHLAGGAVGLRRDLGHGRLFAREQDGLGVTLVRLMGVGVAGREQRGEEQRHPEERDADPAHAFQTPSSVPLRGGLPLLGTRFRHPVPSSPQHRFPLH